MVKSFCTRDAVVNLILGVEAQIEKNGFHTSKAEFLIVDDEDTVDFKLLEEFVVSDYLD